MSLNFVTLTGTLPGGGGATAIFTPSAWLTDAADVEYIPPAPVTVTLSPAGTFSVKLLATDNGAPMPAGWGWTVTITGITGVTANSFSFFLPFSGGATQDISALAPVSSVVAMQAYMPLPAGTPSSGQVPVATGTGEASAWGAAAGGLPAGLAGATAATRYVGATASGSPTGHPFQLGDVDIDQSGSIWICITAGTPGTWTRIGHLSVTATDIQALGVQAAGASGKAADAQHVHPVSVVSGQFLCAPKVFAPGSVTTLSVTGTTIAAFSTGVVCTNSFTVPPSGSVIVTLSCTIGESVSGTAMTVGLTAIGTVTPLVCNEYVWQDSSALAAVRPICMQFLVTGLTPGATAQFDVVGGNGTAGDTTSIVAQAISSTTAGIVKGGPCMVTVQAV